MELLVTSFRLRGPHVRRMSAHALKQSHCGRPLFYYLLAAELLHTAEILLPFSRLKEKKQIKCTEYIFIKYYCLYLLFTIYNQENIVQS